MTSANAWVGNDTEAAAIANDKSLAFCEVLVKGFFLDCVASFERFAFMRLNRTRCYNQGIAQVFANNDIFCSATVVPQR